MTGRLSPREREVLADELLERLREKTPPGLELRAARLVASQEERLGKLVDAADYEVALPAELLGAAQAGVEAALRAERLVVVREVQPKKRRKSGGARSGKHGRGGKGANGGAREGEERQVGPRQKEVDVRPRLLSAQVDRTRGRLQFRLRFDPHGGAPRPREVASVLLGTRVADHRFTRVCLLNEDVHGLVPLLDRGPVFRRPRPGGASSAGPSAPA